MMSIVKLPHSGRVRETHQSQLVRFTHPTIEPPMSPRNPGRREFLLRSAAIAAGVPLLDLRAETPPARIAGRPAPGLADTPASPHVALRSVGLGEVKWTVGFWADRFAECRDVMIPQMWRLMRGTEPSQFYNNFLIA